MRKLIFTLLIVCVSLGLMAQTVVTGNVPSNVAKVVAKVDLTAQAANISATLLYTVTTGTKGTYRAYCYPVVTQAAAGGSPSSVLPSCKIAYVDADSGVTKTVQPTPTANTNTLGTAASDGAWSTPGYVLIQAGAGAINYSTASYASSGTTPMQYAIHIKLEYLGN